MLNHFDKPLKQRNKLVLLSLRLSLKTRFNTFVMKWNNSQGINTDNGMSITGDYAGL